MPVLASFRRTAVSRPLFAALLPAAARRPAALAAHALLAMAALVLLLGFYRVVEGVVERGPVKPRPLAVAGAGDASSGDAGWQCETPTAAAPHAVCRRVSAALTTVDDVLLPGRAPRATGLRTVAFSR